MDVLSPLLALQRQAAWAQVSWVLNQQLVERQSSSKSSRKRDSTLDSLSLLGVSEPLRGLAHIPWTVGWGTGRRTADGRSGTTSRVATESGPKTSEGRKAEEDAFRTNAVIGSGRIDLIEEWVTVVASGDESAVDEWWFEHYHELGLLFCDPLYKPSTKTGSGCTSSLRGSDDECADEACESTRAVPDMDALAASDPPIDIVDLRVGTTDCEDSLAALIRAAWALLLANLDLVRWTACHVYGSDASDCLANSINGMPIEVDSLLDVFSDGGLADVDIYLSDRDWAVAGTSWALRKIVIYAGDYYWDVAVSRWCCGDNTTRACVAVDVATVLFHELTHYCILSWDIGDGSCYDAYVMESVFRWAIFDRYPDLALSPCCSAFYDATTGRAESTIFAASWPFDDISDNCTSTSC